MSTTIRASATLAIWFTLISADGASSVSAQPSTPQPGTVQTRPGFALIENSSTLCDLPECAQIEEVIPDGRVARLRDRRLLSLYPGQLAALIGTSTEIGGRRLDWSAGTPAVPAFTPQIAGYRLQGYALLSGTARTYVGVWSQTRRSGTRSLIALFGGGPQGRGREVRPDCGGHYVLGRLSNDVQAVGAFTPIHDFAVPILTVSQPFAGHVNVSQFGVFPQNFQC